MTPRQLLALIREHREFSEPAADRRGPRPVAPRDNRGSAGWLLAAASQLNRQRPQRAPDMAGFPGE